MGIGEVGEIWQGRTLGKKDWEKQRQELGKKCVTWERKGGNWKRKGQKQEKIDGEKKEDGKWKKKK